MLWKTTEKVLGFETKVYNKEWFDADCEMSIGRRNEDYEPWLGRTTRAENTRNKQLRKECNKDTKERRDITERNTKRTLQNEF
jgi:hypothetical protein